MSPSVRRDTNGLSFDANIYFMSKKIAILPKITVCFIAKIVKSITCRPAWEIMCTFLCESYRRGAHSKFKILQKSKRQSECSFYARLHDLHRFGMRANEHKGLKGQNTKLDITFSSTRNFTLKLNITNSPASTIFE